MSWFYIGYSSRRIDPHSQLGRQRPQQSREPLTQDERQSGSIGSNGVRARVDAPEAGWKSSVKTAVGLKATDKTVQEMPSSIRRLQQANRDGSVYWSEERISCPSNVFVSMTLALDVRKGMFFKRRRGT